MARLNVLTDLTGTITRQTLADIWGDSTVSGVVTSDLDLDTVSAIVASDISSYTANPAPGSILYAQGEQLMYVYTDELDGTGVSLWLAIGPDVFECACIAAEPIPAGAVVQPFYDRWVKAVRPSGDGTTDFYPMGVNQSGLPDPFDIYTEGDTQASGSWIRVAIDGLPRTWFPKEDSGVSEGHFGTGNTFGGTEWVGALDGDRFNGGIGQTSGGNNIIPNQLGQSLYGVTAHSGMSHSYHRIKFGGLHKVGV